MTAPFPGRDEYADTPTDRECLKLDIAEFPTECFDQPGAAGSCKWERGGEKTAELSWQIDEAAGGDGPVMRLGYQVRESDGEDGVTVNQEAPITYTEPNYGGRRPWFECPSCERRSRLLYLPPGLPLHERRFRCRECHDFGYESSRASGNITRTIRLRYNRVRGKLGAPPSHPNSMEPPFIPDRPKGMHQETYDELIDEMFRLEEEFNDEAMKQAFRMLGVSREELAERALADASE